MNKQDINSLIDSLIIDNERGQITAEVLRNVLKTINEGTADGYVYISAATTNTSPIAIKGDEKVFYIAVKEGVYSNFGINDTISELSIIRTYKGKWIVESLGIPLVDLTIELGDSDRKIVTQKKITELYNEGYKYAGVAHTNDKVEPLNGEKKVFMFILQAGIYSNYGISSEITDFSVITSIGKQWFVESLGIPFKLHSKLTEQEQFNDLFSKSLNQIDKAMKDSVLNLQRQIDLLTEGDASAAIESIKEIVAFFAGINDTETLRGILNGLELSLKNEIAEHLPLDGGTMKGNIDMDGKRIDNIGIEEVSSLPTDNLYEGRMVRFKNTTYTFYNGLWLVLSDDLRGHANDTHEENFVYQPTASDLSIKDGFADIKKLKGNTVVWRSFTPDFTNNTVLIPASNYSEFKSAGKIKMTFNNTEDVEFSRLFFSLSPEPVVTGRRYIAILDFRGTRNVEITSNLYFYYNMYNAIVPKDIVNNAGVYKLFFTTISGASDNYLISDVTSGKVKIKVGGEFSVSLSIIDLDALYGENANNITIADFEKLYPNTFYESNEGELMSFNGKGLKSVGFNQWDEKWVLGAYNTSDGSVISGSGGALHIRNTNPIKVLPDTNYYFKSPVTLFVFWYDSNMKLISRNQAKDTTSTSPANAAYLNFYQNSKNTYGNDICINLSHSGYRNGEYEPYEDYKITFQEGKTISQLTGKLNGEGDSVVIFPDGLRSAGEAFDEIVYDEATGKYKAIKRIGSVDMGTLSWNKEFTMGEHWRFRAVSQNNLKPKITANEATKPNCLCINYNAITPESSWLGNRGVSINIKNGYILIADESFADAALLKQSLSGQILYYELEEPEVYELDFPINTSYEAYDFGTEEVLYNDGNEVNIPMKANIEYGFNAVDMIRNNFEEIRTLKERVTALEQAIQQLQAANTANNEQLEQ